MRRIPRRVTQTLKSGLLLLYVRRAFSPDGRTPMAASSRTGMASDLGLLVARILLGAI